MLLRITTQQARVGMFVHRVDGDWLDSPFWTRSFKLARPGDVIRLRQSAITSLVIDLSKGVGPLKATLAVTLSESRRVAAQKALSMPRMPASEERELRRAAAMLHSTTCKLHTLFETVGTGQGLDTGVVHEVVADIETAVRERPRALLTMTRLKSKDEYSYRHSVAVCALVTHFALFLGLDAQTSQNLSTAALLHDIGKITIPSELLGKPGKLTDEEMALMQTHPQASYDLLKDEPDLPDMVRELCLHHHERVDGRGYPAGLSGEAISLPLRILSICDVYDAVTSVRPYKDAWSTKTALAHMSRWRGQFDPVLLLRFFQSIGVAEQDLRRAGTNLRPRAA